MIQPMPDRELPHPTAGLLERVRAGDARAFERLFARAVPRLEWFVRLRTGSGLRARVELEDVLQETFAAALPRLGRFEPRGEGAFVRWLFALAENQIRRLAEHHAAGRRSPARECHAADAALALAADPASGPLTSAARLDVRERIATALASLDPELREALILRLVEELSLAEVAARLGCSESAVRRRVATGAEALGRALERGRARAGEADRG